MKKDKTEKKEPVSALCEFIYSQSQIAPLALLMHLS